jgi:hypothetical protein
MLPEAISKISFLIRKLETRAIDWYNFHRNLSSHWAVILKANLVNFWRAIQIEKSKMFSFGLELL